MIEQIKIPENWSIFNRKGSPLFNKLRRYTDNEKPSFFFSTLSIPYVLENHNSDAVIIVNNNVNPITKNLNEILSRGNIYFVSTSKMVSNKLDEIGLPYVEFPASLITPKPEPIKKGNGIYFYSALGEQRFYGYLRIKEILENHFPHLRLICAQGKKGDPSNPKPRLFPNYTREEIYDQLYPNVFLGIRLTRYDGLSATVQELGLRGIKTIWNGGTPSALSYQTDEDIINHIHRELNNVGTIDTETANEVAEFLNPLNPKYDHVFNLDTYLNKNNNNPKFFK